MRAAPLAAAALLAAGTAEARDPPRFDLLWVPPVRADALRPLPVLMNIPPLWQNGDAAVVLLFEPPAAPERVQALTWALLAEGAAVVELDAHAARGFPAEEDAVPPPPTPASLRADLDATLQALAAGWTHGLLVAIGHGQGVEVVLDAARDPATGLSAGIGLAPEGMRFQAGAPPPSSHGWPVRAPLLCRALAVAEGADRATEQRCVARLDPASSGAPERVSSAP